MDNFTRQQLYAWTYDKIKENPDVFGGDKSNRMIMDEYLKTHYGDMEVLQLPPMVFSILSTVSRVKNKLLQVNPQFDMRKRTLNKRNKLNQDELSA